MSQAVKDICGYCGKEFERVLRSGYARKGCSKECSVNMRYPRSLERFFAKVRELDNGCWQFTGAPNNYGYGQFIEFNKPITAHRWSYLKFKGDIPKGLVVRHTCDNPGCVRPDHLILGTEKDNQRDALNRGRRQMGGIVKLNPDKVREIRAKVAEMGEGPETYEALGQQYGVRAEAIYLVAKRRTWAWVA